MKTNYQIRKQKWDQKNKEYIVDALRQATFVLTVENLLKLLGKKRKGRILDAGCGFGEIDVLLAQKTDFEIVGFDLSKVALAAARKQVKTAGLEKRITIEEGDIFNLKYPKESFDVVISFGYISAATYPGVQKALAQVLKPGGILICDFINCLSAYKFLNTFKRMAGQKETSYYFSLKGIKREFAQAGLIFQQQRFFNTYPPFKSGVNHQAFLAFERTIGCILKKFLARVRIVSFKKK
jgi:2-polyprenyl-3-methyl-5-hydroxy-6-metoxy-1,4-benzoquinol methylase